MTSWITRWLMQERLWEDEWTVVCPVCQFNYSHIREAGTLRGGDEGVIYSGTTERGRIDARRSALSIVFDGECGHSWEWRIQQDRGVNSITVIDVPPEEPKNY